MQNVLSSRLDVAALALAALASGALLAGAHIFEAFGYYPCNLCLDQREAHWAALGVAAAGLIVSLGFKARLVASAAVGAVALVYLFSAGLAFYHTGVEFDFWPGPPTCSGGDQDYAGVDLGQALQDGPSGFSCEDAPWRLLGISMAGYNFLASAGLFALCLGAALISTREVRRSPLGGPRNAGE